MSSYGDHESPGNHYPLIPDTQPPNLYDYSDPATELIISKMGGNRPFSATIATALNFRFYRIILSSPLYYKQMAQNTYTNTRSMESQIKDHYLNGT